MTSTPTRPVENVVITTKGLQDRNNLLLDRRAVENKGKLILLEFDVDINCPNENVGTTMPVINDIKEWIRSLWTQDV